jgi:hypothetical protein
MTEKPTGFSTENHLAQQCHTSKECCSHFVKEQGLTSAMVENAHSMLTGDSFRLEALSWRFLGSGVHARRKQTQETCAMDPWMSLGIFLLGTGAGALTTVALCVKQIRQLKNQLEAAHNHPQTEERCHTNRTSASPPSEGAPNDANAYDHAMTRGSASDS